MSTLLSTLQTRGFVHDISHLKDLEKLLQGEKVTFYCGFDPTAESLHVGSMLPLLVMKRLQDAGHTPIVLLGSATGMIGDPSGKSEERVLLDEKTITQNLEGMRRQIDLFLSSKGANAYQVVENHKWLGSLSFLEFLRDVGKHFSVNAMMAKDSVKSRLENREQGISYTEFSYMLAQAYDFYWLFKNQNCRLQVGGSDQWGNITAGIDFIRKKSGPDAPQAYGMTFPLLTTSSGQKFGKTAKGTVWLSKEKTSPYRFYQYWLNTADEDVLSYIKLFTQFEEKEITELEKLCKTEPEKREAQKQLAFALTELIHGKQEADKSVIASQALFSEQLMNLETETLLDIFSDVPSTSVSQVELGAGIALQELLVRCEMAKSKSAARRLLEGGGVYVNNQRVSDLSLSITARNFTDGALLILRSGKKNFHLLRLT